MSAARLSALLGLLIALHGASAFMGPALSAAGMRTRASPLQVSMQRQGSVLEPPATVEVTETPTIPKTPVAAKNMFSQRGESNSLRQELLNLRASRGVAAATTANEKIVADMSAYAEAAQAAREERMSANRTPQDMAEARAAMFEMRAKKAEEATKAVSKEYEELMAKKAEQQKEFDAFYTEKIAEPVAELKSKTGTLIREEFVERKTTTLTRGIEAGAAASAEPLDLMSMSPERAIKAAWCADDSALLSETASKLAGNKGFDPLGLANADMKMGSKLEAGDETTLVANSQAEIKHARLAMLATVGAIAPNFNIDSGAFMGVAITLFGLLELTATKNNIKNVESEFMVPGDYGFDPAGIYASLSEDDKYLMRYREINNGRLAMFGAAIFLMTQVVPETTPWDAAIRM